ncbi:MAG: PEP-CTERM sorting domain-containing protein [Pirellulaceae bacterium]
MRLVKFFSGVAAMLAACSIASASPILSQFGEGPAPSITSAGGWDGAYVNLTQEVNSQQNQAAFPQLVSGPYSQLKIDFDFRISAGNGGGADGMGVAYVPSSVYGTEGPATLTAVAEEPNLTGAFGVGFDTFNNGADDAESESSVSLHWDGALVQTFGLDASPLGIFENSEVHHAEIIVTPNGSGSNVTVNISDPTQTVTAVDNVFIDGLLPYDGRMIFSARTGGANSQQDIDNVRLMHMTGGNKPMTTVLYTFVPEPSSVSLVLMGLAGLASMVRRRR